MNWTRLRKWLCIELGCTTKELIWVLTRDKVVQELFERLQFKRETEAGDK